ncbi:hypothetical protein B0H11DRAFT_1922676 [Mycena galericulata]|nr:hypothetical protein B0H11DRAFT_1922676 [Mycena galericulata]
MSTYFGARLSGKNEERSVICADLSGREHTFRKGRGFQEKLPRIILRPLKSRNFDDVRFGRMEPKCPAGLGSNWALPLMSIHLPTSMTQSCQRTTFLQTSSPKQVKHTAGPRVSQIFDFSMLLADLAPDIIFSIFFFSDVSSVVSTGQDDSSFTPSVTKQIILLPEITAGDGMGKVAKLLPSGLHVLFNNARVLECWSVAEDRLIWRHTPALPHAEVVMIWTAEIYGKRTSTQTGEYSKGRCDDSDLAGERKIKGGPIRQQGGRRKVPDSLIGSECEPGWGGGGGRPQLGQYQIGESFNSALPRCRYGKAMGGICCRILPSLRGYRLIVMILERHKHLNLQEWPIFFEYPLGCSKMKAALTDTA